jgi:hypothetical protein
MKHLLCFALAIAPSLYGAAAQRKVEISSDDRVLPHIAFGGGWTTTITLVNLWEVPADFTLRFYADNGAPLTVPVSGAAPAALITGNIPVGAVRKYVISNSAGAAVSGWAEVDYNWNNAEIGVSAVFTQRVAGRPDFEAIVPVARDDEFAFIVPFDNTNGLKYGVALACPSDNASTYTVIFRDAEGALIGQAASITLPGKGHTAFVLTDRYPQLADRVGSVEFRQDTGGYLQGLALRFNAPGGNAFTTAPVYTSHLPAL